MKPSLKVPACIRAFIADQDSTEAEARTFVLESCKGFADITEKATTEAGWLSFKLSCSVRQAQLAIQWAKSST